ncbi:hypothetical protein KFL_001820190 [Klebsormidium nitens]|uniref:Uncharacterized protein n=1 Tax=Klebsormidium nitens TaxID=105231 RepID=A0A1Y1I6B9_KLENI|nr:hypothetical protein KFL_001820190 [Klebsormidium nitens]|eukprot:GAQ84266.1 hypothetical protein KFL_001820190 [Klebsormidium nitens]
MPEVKSAIHGVIVIATLEEYASRRDGAAARKLSELEECRKESGPIGLRNKLIKIWDSMTEKDNNEFLPDEEPCKMHMQLRSAVLEYLFGRLRTQEMQALLLLTQLNVLANQWDAQGVRVLLDQIERDTLRAHPGLETEDAVEVLDVCQEASCKKHAKRNAKIDERNELVVRTKRILSVMEKDVQRLKPKNEDVEDCFGQLVDVLHKAHKPTPRVTSGDEESTKLLLLVLLQWMRARSPKDARVRELVRELQMAGTRALREPLEMALNFLNKRADVYGDANARSMVDEFERTCDADALHERVLRASETGTGHRDYRAAREFLMRAHAAAMEGHSAYDKLVRAFLEHDALHPCAFFLCERLLKGGADAANVAAAEMNMVKELRERATQGDRLASELVANWTVKDTVRFAVKATSGRKYQEIGGSRGWELGRFGLEGRFGGEEDDVSSDEEETGSNGWRGHARSGRMHESRGWLATSTGVMSRHVALRESKSEADSLRTGNAKGLETRDKETVSSQSAIRKGFFDRPQKKAIEREEPLLMEHYHPFSAPPPPEEEEADDPFKRFQEERRNLPSDDEEYEDTVSECSEAAETASVDTVCYLIELCEQPVEADVPADADPKDQDAQLQGQQLQMYEVD